METPIHFVGWIYGNSMRADVDNYLKACLDACVLSGIIPNDNCKHVQSARIYFLKEAKEKEQVIMEVESL